MTEQNMKTLANAIKEYYLPVLDNQIGIEPSALLAKTKKVALKSDKVVTTAPIGLSGGFGFGEEGGNTPTSGAVRYERFVTRPKDMYVDIAISAKATKLTGSAGAMIDAMDSEIRAAHESAKWNVGRALFGNGEGILTTFSASASSSNTLTVTDTKLLKEGLTVDIYKTGGVTPQAGGSGRRILEIDRENKTVTLSGTPQTFEAGFITVQNSYKKEITGLGAIFDPKVTKIYDIEKASNKFLQPLEISASNDINDGVIQKILRQSRNFRGGDCDTILCGDDAFDNYLVYLRTNNIRVEDATHEITGGFKAIKFTFGNQNIDIVNESFVPEGEMWGVNSRDCEFHSTGWDFVTPDGGAAFNLMENKSVFRALLANYGEFICKKPGACFRIKDCA